MATTAIAFVDLTPTLRMEFLAGEPSQPSWWRDVYRSRGKEVHHQGYTLHNATDVWDVVQRFSAAGLGAAVQWGRWGTEDRASGGCYVYMDSQETLGVTVEILSSSTGCDSLPAQPPAA